MTPTPFRFDGHGINDSNGQRICKVSSCDPYSDGNKRNLEFDRLSNLFAAAPDLLYACENALEDPDDEHAIAVIEAAINKAKGENYFLDSPIR